MAVAFVGKNKLILIYLILRRDEPKYRSIGLSISHNVHEETA